MLAVATGRITALALTVLGAGFALSADASTTVSGIIEDGTVWTATGSPYIAGNITIQKDNTLTIEPGVIVKFKENNGLSIYGTLLAEGTEDDKVYFTSLKDDAVGGDSNGDGDATTPAPLDWQQLRIFETGDAEITHAVIRYGGETDPLSGIRNCGPGVRHCRGGITNVGRLEVRDSEIIDNYGYQLYQLGGTSTVERSTLAGAVNGFNVNLEGGSFTLRHSAIEDSHSHGILAEQGAEKLELFRNSFTGNGGASAVVDASTTFIHEGNSANGDAVNAFRIVNAFAEETAWSADGIPYQLGGTVTVPEDITLTIEPGVVVKGDESSGLAVNGSLSAIGTKEEPIYLTSLKDDSVGGDTNGDGDATAPAPGDWTQIRNFNTASTTLEHVVLSFGGISYRPGLNNCGVDMHFCRGTISNAGLLSMHDSEIRGSQQIGLYQTAGKGTVNRMKIASTSHSGPAIEVEDGVMTVRGSSLSENERGIDAFDALKTVDARENWWGSDTGPHHPDSNPDGLGANVSDNVLFEPWLMSDPFSEPEIDPLILKYEPILYLHPDENYEPMNVEAFIEASALWDDNGLLPDTQLKPASTTDPVTVNDIAVPGESEDWYLAFSEPGEAKSFDPVAAKTKYDQLKVGGKAVPTYYAHRMEDSYTDESGETHEFIVLQYWYFYAFNDWEVHGGRNNHEGDWESVFIYLEKETKEPKYVTYSAHLNDGDPNNSLFQYDSVRRSWSTSSTNGVEISGNQVKSYASLGSHANYPGEGVFDARGFYDKASSEGLKLETNDWVVGDINSLVSPEWMLYEGKWGADSILVGFDGPKGPKYLAPSFGGGVTRFLEPIQWAGIDNIIEKTVEEETDVLSFLGDTVTMLFEGLLESGDTVSVDQHNELITFGRGLENISFLPHFWDLESSLGKELPTTTVTFSYDETEVADFGIIENDLSVYFYNESTDTWEAQPSLLNTAENSVSFITDHFSRYAIGAPKLEDITEDVEIKKRWGRYDPHSGTREAGVGIDGATGTVRLLVAPTEEDVNLLNNTGTTTDGTQFIDVTLDEKKPFDARLLFSVSLWKNVPKNGQGVAKYVPPMLDFGFDVHVKKGS